MRAGFASPHRVQAGRRACRRRHPERPTTPTRRGDSEAGLELQRSRPPAPSCQPPRNRTGRTGELLEEWPGVEVEDAGEKSGRLGCLVEALQNWVPRLAGHPGGLLDRLPDVAPGQGCLRLLKESEDGPSSSPPSIAARCRRYRSVALTPTPGPETLMRNATNCGALVPTTGATQPPCEKPMTPTRLASTPGQERSSPTAAMVSSARSEIVC